MPIIGLTGGIASGKSEVAALLTAKGAIVFDADAIARELVEPGMPALEEIREHFGPGILRSDGTLDREKLGEMVFSDPRARMELNAVLHPRIFSEIRRRLSETDSSKVRVVEAALLVESAPWESGELKLDALIVVDSTVSLQVERLAAGRGMNEREAVARIGAQINSAARRAAADYVIENTGTLAELESAVDRVWSKFQDRQAGGLSET
ncbi:MAG: dephospho-CoA kinase [Actinomycetota bacterium]